jgi:DNA-binding IclR family transcriptional regulator
MNFTNTEKSGTVSMTKQQARVAARSIREQDIIRRYKARMEELRKRIPKSVRLTRVKNAKEESMIEKIMFSESSDDEPSL